MIFKYLIYGLIGGGVAFFSGFAGLGGGFFLVPFFFFIFSASGDIYTSGHLAVGTSIFVITFNSLSAFITHSLQKNVDLKRGGLLIAGGILGVVMGLFLHFKSGGRTVMLIFGCLEVLIGILMYRKDIRVKSKKSGKNNIILTLLTGFVAGCFSSFFGIGGGIVAVPAQTIILGASIHSAIGTTSLLIFTNAIFSTGIYACNKLVDYRLGFTVAFFSIFSSFLGARISIRTNAILLRRIFSLLLVLIGISTFIKAF